MTDTAATISHEMIDALLVPPHCTPRTERGGARRAAGVLVRHRAGLRGSGPHTTFQTKSIW
jgi:hypothetical protein